MARKLFKFEQSYDFVEKNQAEQTALGVIYRAGVIDSQGDYALAPDLEKAVEFLSDNPNWPRVIDVEHTRQRSHSKLVESYVARSDGPFYKTSDWIGRIKVADDVWPRVESGELRAFSIYGRAGREKTIYQGREATRMRMMETEFISLVPNGANQVQFIAKADVMPAWFRSYSAKLDKQLTIIEDRIKGSSRKRVRRIAEVARPKRKLGRRPGGKVTPKTDIEKMKQHRQFRAALDAIKSDQGGNFTDAQYAEMINLKDESGLGPDALWGDLFRVTP